MIFEIATQLEDKHNALREQSMERVCLLPSLGKTRDSLLYSRDDQSSEDSPSQNHSRARDSPFERVEFHLLTPPRSGAIS